MKTCSKLYNKTTSDKLAAAINKNMEQIDENMSVYDFASATTKILREDYGTHNFKPFLDQIKKELT